MSFLDSLEMVKSRGGNKWFACCPVHQEKTPSLSIKQNEDGSYIMHCFGCGANGNDVFNALGLNKDELFGYKERGNYIPEKIKEEYELDKYVIAVYEADKKNGRPQKLVDHRRYRLALTRSEGIRKKWVR